MKLRLISGDQELHQICREVLSSYPGHEWTLLAAEQGDSIQEADLYLWDYAPGMSIPAGEGGSSHLFLVGQDDFAAFEQSASNPRVNYLLKPITRPALAAFVRLALSARRERLLDVAALRSHPDDMLQCLIQANLKLQEHEQERTNFLVRAVHDFRAPLTALSGYCCLLLSQGLGELQKRHVDVLRRMQYSTNRLSRISDALFEFGVENRGMPRREFEEGDIEACINQAIQENRPFAAEKRILISLDLIAPTSSFYFEPRQIEQLVINLLENSCRFTQKGGSIEVRGYPFFQQRTDARLTGSFAEQVPGSVSREPNHFRMDVCDTGSHIPEVDLERVFEEYTEYAGRHDRSGGGLGLSICRMIVNQHRGKIWAENTNTGTMFSFLLPLRDVSYTQTRQQPTESKTEVVGAI